MKDQYFADERDLLKYDLAIYLTEELPGIERFTFIPMLTANDGSSEGGQISYPRGVGRPALYDFLQDCLRNDTRQVSRLREYFQDQHDFEYCPHGDTHDLEFTNSSREQYFKTIPDRNLERAIILLDPDIGLKARSATRGDLHKYLLNEEVKSVFNRMDERSVLIIYQHLPRLPRPTFIYGTQLRLMESLRCPAPCSISDGSVALIMLTKGKDRRKALLKSLKTYLRLNLTLFN